MCLLFDHDQNDTSILIVELAIAETEGKVLNAMFQRKICNIKQVSLSYLVEVSCM